LAAAKALEVEGGQASEDHQANDRVDQRAVGDLDEDRNDPKMISPIRAQNRARASAERSRRVA
jgi:hypothetical protein